MHDLQAVIHGGDDGVRGGQSRSDNHDGVLVVGGDLSGGDLVFQVRQGMQHERESLAFDVEGVGFLNPASEDHVSCQIFEVGLDALFGDVSRHFPKVIGIRIFGGSTRGGRFPAVQRRRHHESWSRLAACPSIDRGHRVGQRGSGRTREEGRIDKGVPRTMSPQTGFDLGDL